MKSEYAYLGEGVMRHEMDRQFPGLRAALVKFYKWLCRSNYLQEGSEVQFFGGAIVFRRPQ